MGGKGRGLRVLRRGNRAVLKILKFYVFIINFRYYYEFLA